MSDLFRKPLTEKYRQTTWADVVEQDKVVGRIHQLAKRDALAGRAFWLSGQSGTGKTTIARLIAQEVADEFMIEEVDATSLTVPALVELEKASALSGWGDKKGRAFIVNETHGLRKDVIRQFLVVLERVPAHVVWVFTTTCEGQESLFENYSDGSPLLSRCLDFPLARRAAASTASRFARSLLVKASATTRLGMKPPSRVRRSAAFAGPGPRPFSISRKPIP
jgi:replication-associated recombination protein RarA